MAKVYATEAAVRAADAASPVAQIFPQPRLADGRRLDAAVGLRFALLADPALLDAVGSAERGAWAAQDVAVLPADGDELPAWLRAHGVAAVLLRPDRYVAGVACDAGELRALMRRWPGLTAPPSAGPASGPPAQAAAAGARR